MTAFSQPPSGGCVLKRLTYRQLIDRADPAAFGRLCVETPNRRRLPATEKPAAFGRLCVETKYISKHINSRLPAAFGRLCVETNRLIWG